MSNSRNRRRPPMSVAEAEAALERAKRREAAATAYLNEGQGSYRMRPNVNLATLDTPDVSHADQWADFLNRPGRFYVASIDVALDDDPMGQKLTTTTTFKADEGQLPYLVEVLRQVRGAFGAHTRISLAPAEPHVEERRIAGPALRTSPVTKQGATMTLTDEDWRDRSGQRPATAEELDAIREMRNTVDAPPWAVRDGEFTREELVEMLPGQTRAQVAEDLGKTPESLGGTIHAADVMPEDLAAELGVPVESLTRIPMTGGGHAWSVKPGERQPRGRHAAPDETMD